MNNVVGQANLMLYIWSNKLYFNLILSSQQSQKEMYVLIGIASNLEDFLLFYLFVYYLFIYFISIIISQLLYSICYVEWTKLTHHCDLNSSVQQGLLLIFNVTYFDICANLTTFTVNRITLFL